MVPLVFGLMCGACKEYKDIAVDISGGEIVFVLPQLPSLGTVYVEALDTERDAFEIVWSISFVSGSAPVQRITYGKAPAGTKVDVMSDPVQLKTGVLYTVGMDVGPIVAKGIFVIEGNGAERKVKNLTYQEATAFREESRHKRT
jgi:hypothetical protein